ncbi:uncharacterized protein LOC121420320 [Lytechinus variegatus]|uniref:uncharacterized protein LOC121420320 n=1 Tax=Lytechinus variegatus TaxID=7654 RepID=UPI001BB12730|nr:uncharacterized protein LOC121420320 [Lytechinus variegatus]
MRLLRALVVVGVACCGFFVSVQFFSNQRHLFNAPIYGRDYWSNPDSERSLDISYMSEDHEEMKSDNHTAAQEISTDHIKKWLPDTKNLLPNYFTMRDNVTNERRYADGILVYMHLNKAAGTTTKTCLSMMSKTRPNPKPVVTVSEARARIQTDIKNGKLKYDILMGDYSFGICDAVGNKSCSYFTILRDPYERLLSSFSYCKRAKDQLCEGLNPWEADLKRWAVHQGSYFFRQLLMKPWFCGANPEYAKQGLDGIPHSKGRTFSNTPCWFRQKVILKRALTSGQMDILLQYCVEHLEEWFTMIGLTEQYDLTLRMLEKVYHLPFQKTCGRSQLNKSDYRNVARSRRISKEKSVVEWKRNLKEDPEVYEALRADIVIYEKAKEIFKRQSLAFLTNNH